MGRATLPFVGDGEKQQQHPKVEDMFRVAVEAFRVIGEDKEKSRRMSDAGLTCAMHITDLDEGLTALLDRNPIEVEDKVLPDAQARIFGTSEAWLPVFLKGNIGIVIARGELEYEGPVREFLRVFPIFRTAYADVARGKVSKSSNGGRSDG
ncbi:MAG: hypothetical protein QOF76_5174 [Solirubrobacteraceae bacterium]|jgi:hypothetical protein|nr:hypothetical protein [Solirubrobacteraceae bacterium]